MNLGPDLMNRETKLNRVDQVEQLLAMSARFNYFSIGPPQGYNARKGNCSCVYCACILKPVLSGRDL